MPIKFYCDYCNKEIFTHMDKSIKETETIAEVEAQCVCSDCILKLFKNPSEGSFILKGNGWAVIRRSE